MTLQEAIQQRHSVRQYQPKPIEKEKIEALLSAINECNQKSGLHMQLVTDEPNAFAGGLAKYGKFSEVNNYIAMICKKGQDTLLGFYGERIVLTAQTLGLNTCWVGLTFRKQPYRYEVREDETLICVVALGYGSTQGKAHPQKKGIEHYCKVEGTMPDWFRRGMEAVLLAPTAINQQKFEFQLIAPNIVKAMTRFTLLNSYAKIDLGIAMCHFAIGAGEENFQFEEMP